MSQEEEKFIEEFREKLGDVYCRINDNLYFEDIDFAAKAFLENFILKAYQTGKLAGFEMCKEISQELKPIGIFASQTYISGYNCAIFDFKSLIEEEKKKL